MSKAQTAKQAAAMGPVEWALLLSLAIIWGGSFFFFGVLVKVLPVFTIVFCRVALAAAALWLVVRLMGLTAPRETRVWIAFLVMGFLNNFIPFSLIAWGQKEVAPGLAAVLNATTPFFTVIVAHFLTTAENLSWNRLAGSVVGLAGVGAMVGVDALGGAGNDLLHQLAFVAAALSYAFGAVWGRRFAGLHPIVTSAGQATASSLLLLPVVLAVDRPWLMAMPALTTIASLLGLALVCTALAYVMFFTILKRSGATNISLVTFLVPVSAMLLGAAFLDEVIGLRHLAGMLAIGAGLALIDGRLLDRGQF